MALHAKALVNDRDKVFIGSANLDPRSLRLNTEMGLLVESNELNAASRLQVEPDFLPANAWHLRLDDDGQCSGRGGFDPEFIDHIYELVHQDKQTR